MAGKVIVADAELHTSLSVIRELHKIKLRVISISRGKSGGYLSKYCWKKFNLSDLGKDLYIDFIKKIAEIEKVDAIFGHYEDTLMMLYSKIEDSSVNIIMPPYDQLKLAIQKDKMLSIAKKIGLYVPKTARYSARQNEKKSLLDVISIFEGKYPLFAKVDSEVDKIPGPGSRYMIIKTQDDLPILDQFINRHESLLIQEYIEGHGCGIAGVFFNGEPICIGGHIRLRERFVTGGASTYCISKIYKPALDNAILLMKHLRWSGIAMIEFKIGKCNGNPYFMEVNPRLWGTLPLYIKSGINVPVVAYNLFVKNMTINSSSQMKKGIKMRFLVQDLKSIKEQYKGLKLIWEISKSIFTTPWWVKEGIFCWEDPMPFVIPFTYSTLKKLKTLIKI